MNHGSSAYGLWSLVLINSAIFIIFAFSFAKPRTKRDWRSFGAFSAFLVALFTEMYGFPLTIYLLSGWLSRRAPGVGLFSHDAGHLWETLFGWEGNAHFNPIHIASNLIILGGFLLLSAAWPVLYKGAAKPLARHHGALCPDAPSPVHRVHPRHGGLPSPVADTRHTSDVPCPGLHVRSAGAAGRAGGTG